MKVRAANFLISRELFSKAFHFPDNCKLIGVEWDFPRNALRAYIESPDLAEVPEGDCIPTIAPLITQHVDEHNTVSFTWDWNQNKYIKLEM